MPKIRFVIGMDGGGTKTALIAASLGGEILLEHEGGPSNFQIIGTKRAARTLVSLIKKTLETLGEDSSQLGGVVCGLTGAGRDHDKERIREAVLAEAKNRRIAVPDVWIESDARIALEGAFKGAPGIIVIAGTGSIAFGKNEKDEIFRVGGWGRVIGDEGGGFVVGRDALKAVARMLDGRGEKTKLSKLFETEANLKDQQSIISFLYEDGKDPATLAPLVIKAAAGGDEVAQRILTSQAEELAEHVGALVQKMRIPRRIPLAIIGSMGLADHQYGRLVRTKISKRVPSVLVQDQAAPPVYGAVLMALKRLKLQPVS